MPQSRSRGPPVGPATRKIKECSNAPHRYTHPKRQAKYIARLNQKHPIPSKSPLDQAAPQPKRHAAVEQAHHKCITKRKSPRHHHQRNWPQAHSKPKTNPVPRTPPPTWDTVPETGPSTAHQSDGPGKKAEPSATRARTGAGSPDPRVHRKTAKFPRKHRQYPPMTSPYKTRTTRLILERA